MQVWQVLLIFALAGVGHGGYNDNNCGIDIELVKVGMLSELGFINEPFEDKSTSEKLFEFEIPANVSDVEIGGYYSSKYMQAEVEGDLPNQRKVVIKSTEAFSQLEYELQSSKDAVELEMDFALTCGEGYYDSTDFIFIQPITDTNNHIPMFNRKEYEYHFGMAIREGADLTQLMEIYAVDIDVTNTKLEFSIDENEDLQIEYVDSDYATGKIHFARLFTKRELTTGKTYTYTIKAKDNAEQPQTGTATVKVIID